MMQWITCTVWAVCCAPASSPCHSSVLEFLQHIKIISAAYCLKGSHSGTHSIRSGGTVLLIHDTLQGEVLWAKRRHTHVAQNILRGRQRVLLHSWFNQPPNKSQDSDISFSVLTDYPKEKQRIPAVWRTRIDKESCRHRSRFYFCSAEVTRSP